MPQTRFPESPLPFAGPKRAAVPGAARALEGRARGCSAPSVPSAPSPRGGERVGVRELRQTFGPAGEALREGVCDEVDAARAWLAHVEAGRNGCG